MDSTYNLTDYIYDLPASLIAQEPLLERDKSRLLAVGRHKGGINECLFKDIAKFFKRGDVLVLNDTKVIKARLWATKPTGAKIEVLVLENKSENLWTTLVKPAKRLKNGSVITFGTTGIYAEVLERNPDGTATLCFSKDIKPLLDDIGDTPLPHYIKSKIKDPNRYQTIYARKDGAVAAPTAGFHFTNEVLDEIIKKEVNIVYLTLHCGLGTFRPIEAKDIRSHNMMPESMEISLEAALAINKAKADGGKIFAVGTTCVRALESLAYKDSDGFWRVKDGKLVTSLYITPGYDFKIIDALITNFHTPASTNLILVSAFCGYEKIQESYRYAIKNKFRFFSFGDAMIII